MRQAFTHNDIWLFSVATFGDRKPLLGSLMKREPKNIGELHDTIGPREYRVFAGVIDRRRSPRSRPWEPRMAGPRARRSFAGNAENYGRHRAGCSRWHVQRPRVTVVAQTITTRSSCRR